MGPYCSYLTAIRPILKTKCSGAANLPRPPFKALLKGMLFSLPALLSVSLSPLFFSSSHKSAKASINLWSRGILLVLAKVLLK